MNLQNIPREQKDVKRAFVPKLDAFMFFDYKNIEVRLLAFYLSQGIGDDAMAERFRNDPEYDPHTETAAMLFNKSFDDVLDTERQVGKVLNFSVIYGGGTPTIMRQLGIEYMTAKKYLDGFHDARPGIKVLTQELANTVASRGYIKNLYGRRFHPESDHKALNGLIQGCAADLMKLAIIKVDDGMKLLESHIVNTVHDEIMIDACLDEVDGLAESVPELMRDEQIHAIVPIEVDIAYSTTNWADKKDWGTE